MNGNHRTSVLLADDHPVVLQGLNSLLGSDSRLVVRSVCARGDDALAELRKHEFGIAILDIGLPGLSGLEVAKAITEDGLKTEIILLTAAASDRQREEARRLGATLLFKDAAAEELLEVVSARIAVGTSSSCASPSASSGESPELTQRERQVAGLVAEGISNKEIARRLALSEATVKAHLHNAFSKTGLTSRTALAAYILKN